MEKVLVAAGARYADQIDRLRGAGLEPVVKEISPFLPPDAFARAVTGYEYAICNGPWTAEVLRAARDRLKLVVKFGVGVDNIDTREAARLGIAVANAPGCNADAVAEQAVLLMLACVRRLPELDARLRAGEWVGDTLDTLVGKTVGLLGFGRIARRVAAMLRGFPVRVIACDIRMDGEAAAALGVKSVTKDELRAQADIISLHVALTDETRRMVDATFLSGMKRDAYLINTSRGAVVDEAALCAALANGAIRGAGLDTFETEPLDPESPLRALKNVVLTPHAASNTDEAYRAIMRTCVDDVLAFAEGRALNLVNA